jgi:hypothetical protein
MNKAKRILLQGGFSPEGMTTEFSPSLHRPDVVRGILEAAHNRKCGTLLVEGTRISDRGRGMKIGQPTASPVIFPSGIKTSSNSRCRQPSDGRPFSG